jgi:hypothetical protein
MACLAQLLDLLARRYQLVPSPTQTPREFAEIAGRALRSRPETEAFANLPCSIVAVYYRARFGGELISSDELQELELRLERLTALYSGMGTKRI